MRNRFILTPYYLDHFIHGYMPVTEPNWHINRPSLPRGTAQIRMGALYKPLVDFVTATISLGERPVSLAGDCCTCIGVTAGIQRAGIKATLIWFDAHGDFNTWETTPSGFLGGMPLAILVGRGDQTIVDAVGLQPIPESHVILTDARDLDPGEKDALAASEVIHLRDVENLLNYPLPERPLHVHFDTDVIDPDDAPAMNYPSPGGPSLETLTRVFRHLAASKRIVAVSLSAWNPDLDQDGHSQETSMRLLRELLSD